MKEEEAIEILKEWIEVDRRMRNNSKESDFDKFCEEKNIAIETVLQLIEKMREECKKCVIRDDLHNYIEETEKKDKIIDKMAEQLVKAHGWFYSEFDNYTKEDFKEYFNKKVEN